MKKHSILSCQHCFNEMGRMLFVDHSVWPVVRKFLDNGPDDPRLCTPKNI